MKLNPAHAIFDGNMFVQLRGLLGSITPPANLGVLDLSIGEPQQPPAALLIDSVSRHNDQWQFYPKATGSPRFTAAIEGYIARRWPEAAGLADANQIIPVPGTREPLFARQNCLKLRLVQSIVGYFRQAWSGRNSSGPAS